MKKILFLIIIVCSLNSNAQNYLISFSGSGASITVNSVKVENLTSGTTLTINGNDILHLTAIITGLNSSENGQLSPVKIWPNPMEYSTILEITPPVSGAVTISLVDMTGKTLTHSEEYLENSPRRFQITGVPSGSYLINIKGDSYSLAGKLLSNGAGKGAVTIDNISNNQATAPTKAETITKGTQATVDMSYTSGDRLKFTGIAGNYRTVITDIPATSKSINFDFMACMDGEDYSYPVVSIGNQHWMAENLKTSKYRNGDLIGSTTPATLDISGEGMPSYQWPYNGNESYVSTYGRLYTWYAVTDSRNVCPAGWHLPSDSEFTTLVNHLTETGCGYEGSGSDIAKALATASGWKTYAVAGTPGNDQKSNNASGFTALGGGYRNIQDNAFYYVGDMAYFWSSTEISPTNASYRFLYYYLTDLGFTNTWKKYGYSVRCLKDLMPGK